MRTGLWAVVLILAGSACSSDTTSPVPEAGTYVLVSVNGATVPTVTTENATIKTEVLSGTLVIGSDGNFSETREGRVTLNGGSPSNVTTTQSGTWSDNAGVLTFSTGTVSSPVTFSGTWTAGVISYTSAGATFKYVVTVSHP